MYAAAFSGKGGSKCYQFAGVESLFVACWQVETMYEKKPEEVLRRAVAGMLPKNTLRRERLKLLRIFAGPQVMCRRETDARCISATGSCSYQTRLSGQARPAAGVRRRTLENARGMWTDVLQAAICCSIRTRPRPWRRCPRISSRWLHRGRRPKSAPWMRAVSNGKAQF